MGKFGELYQSGDWKGEKHVPVIHIKDKVKKGEIVELRVNIGEEIPHPNTLEHHIKWMKVYFHGEGDKFPVEIGNYVMNSHGEYGVFTEPDIIIKFKVEKSGTIYATSYCNIHGLWENSKKVEVE
ncbi:class II SORL domain-containing protein [Thermoanaerobacter uzonensis]|uniref:class II SORL domain-containing protein n=1 Tax=Thermoanaerobacter uzonensis TaxID=447593 RepID=UPI003D768C2C